MCARQEVRAVHTEKDGVPCRKSRPWKGTYFSEFIQSWLTMNTLPLGVRLVIILPTLLFLASQILRYGLKIRARKELMTQQAEQFRSVFMRVADQSSREFRWEFFIDSVILSIANGLIFIFQLGRIEYGVVLLVAGVIAALGGLVATEANSGAAVGFLIVIMILLFLGEMTYFAFFGMSFDLLGFTVRPWQMFFLPSVLFCLVVAIFGLRVRRAKRRGRP